MQREVRFADRQAPFDPITEGVRYRLSGDDALALWKQVSAEARDDELARRRFHARARTHRSAKAARLVPGRETLVTAEARRWTSLGFEPEAPAATLTRTDFLPRAAVAPARILRHAESEPDHAGAGHIDDALRVSHGGPMPTTLRRDMERVLGQPFADVQLHLGDAAHAAAEAVGALAFTVGNHIYFRRGAFAPTSAAGRELIAHELAHVLQWRRGEVPAPSGNDHHISQPGDALEREAVSVASTIDRQPATPAPNVDAVATPSPALGGQRAVLRAPASPGVAVAQIPDGGTPVNKVGIVAWDAPPPLKLRSSADTSSDANIIRTLPFNAKVQVIKAMPGGWLFVSTDSGQMGYASASYIKTNLPEPGATLQRVKGGVDGTAIAIAEQHYKAYANNWGQDLRFYVNVLASANKRSVPDDATGWQSLHFNAGEFIWIPSANFASSLKGTVNSGSISYNAAESLGKAIERIEELIEDFRTAISLAGKYIPSAIARHAAHAAIDALVGMAKMLAGAFLLTAVLTAGGALIGGPAGAAIGVEAAMQIINWLGLAMLIHWVVQSMAQIGGAFGSFVTMVWNAHHDAKQLDAAARQLGEALGTLVGVLIEAVVMYVAAEGAGKALGALKDTTFGRTLGEDGLRRIADKKAEQKPEAKAEQEPELEPQHQPEPQHNQEAPQPQPEREPDPRPAEEVENDAKQKRRYARYLKTSKSKLPFREWWEKYGRKPSPNPDGKPGNAAHQATVDKLVQRAREEFPNDIVLQEKSIKGRKTMDGKEIDFTREPDVTVIDRNTGAVKKVYEAARTKKDGTFVKRELDKEAQYDKLGIENHFERVQEPAPEK